MIIEREHFDYLVLQKGEIDPALRGDLYEWTAAYKTVLEQSLETIRPYLPVKSVLDIGSGLGGIDALIVKACGPETEVALLDGLFDQPKMILHRQTFSNAAVARDFLQKNGVRNLTFVDPNAPEDLRYPADLILSCGSWCFHYPPATYLEYVKRQCHRDTVLIIDVRTGKHWDEVLQQHFVKQAVLWSPNPKFDRIVYRPM